MTYRRTALALFVFTILSAPAFAATATMVQFGAFETRAEAEARLAEVKQKHAGLVGVLDTAIREVPIGEGMTTYRTQAGPVANKAAAQAICAQLASNGDECYVVETAMAQPTAAPATNIAEAVAAPKAAVASAKKAVSDAVSTTLADAASVASTLPTNAASIPARDPRNVAALAGVSVDAAGLNQALPKTDAGVAPALEASAIPAVPNASPALQAAMDKAIAEEEKAQASVAVKPAPQKSLLQRLNPFASDAAPVEPKPAPTKLAEVEALPPAQLPPVADTTREAAQKIIDAAPESPSLKPAAVKLAAVQPVTPAPKAPEPAVVITPVVQPPVVEAPKAAPKAEAPVVALAPTPAAPPPLQLPPPPVPILSAAAAPVIVPPVAQPVVVQPPVSIATAPVYAATPSSLVPPMPEPTGVNVPPPPMVASVPGPNVRVEEAQRVPLTQGAMPVPPAPIAAMPPALNSSVIPPNAVVSLSPSATIGQKTIWAQMGSFADAQEALAFWDNYRMAHPDFPSVRVRVTNAVSAINRGDMRQWLRVGPFAREGYVSALCASLVTPEGKPVRAGLQCGRVVDMGVSSSGDTRTPGYLPGSRYKR